MLMTSRRVPTLTEKPMTVTMIRRLERLTTPGPSCIIISANVIGSHLSPPKP